MTWASDVTDLTTAVRTLSAYANAREANTPQDTLDTLKNTAQVAMDAVTVQMSATFTMPKKHPTL